MLEVTKKLYKWVNNYFVKIFAQPLLELWQVLFFVENK